MKKRKLSHKEYLKIAKQLEVANQLREDSIAYLIKEYFTLNTLHNKEMFKWDKETKKILVSKKALNHLLRLCGSELLEHNFDFELVDEIKILQGEDK